MNTQQTEDELSRVLFREQDDDNLPALLLLELGSDSRATDIHIDPEQDGFAVRLRIDGHLRELGRLSSGDGGHLENQFRALASIDPGRAFVPRGAHFAAEVDGSDIDVRLTLAPCIDGPKLALRLLDPKRVRLPLNQLGMDGEQLEKIEHWLLELGGLFIVSGPTGSGKTTTLYALLHQLTDRGRHLLTAEDPVEYHIDGINQIQVDKTHGLDFPSAIRCMLRLDPDDLMVGETRDSETAAAAIRAAISGHTVLTTLHARDVVAGVTALRIHGASDYEISSAASVFVNQRLVRLLCPDCRDEANPTHAESRWLEARDITPPPTAMRPGGCSACSGTGYHHRTGIFETWHLEQGDFDLLLAGAPEQELRSHQRQTQRTNLVDAAMTLVREGRTSLAEAMSACAGVPKQPAP